LTGCARLELAMENAVCAHQVTEQYFLTGATLARVAHPLARMESLAPERLVDCRSPQYLLNASQSARADKRNALLR
jgi:hypothetical protein